MHSRRQACNFLPQNGSLRNATAQLWSAPRKSGSIPHQDAPRPCGSEFARSMSSNQSRPRRLVLGACAVGCFGWTDRRFAGNETSGCLLASATRGHRPAGGRGMPVDGPGGTADWGRIALFHAAASPCIRFMFSARHTRAHSPRAWSRPRTLKRRKPSACLIQPSGASDSHLRLA